MRTEKKRIIILLFIAAVSALLAVHYPAWKWYNALKIERDSTDHAVVLNKYAKEDWNNHYGHCDLTIEAEEGKMLCVEFDGEVMEGSSLTFSYGPSAGNNSPARVNVYVGHRKDHLPIDRAVVSDDLTDEEFESFMQWFSGVFSSYSRKNDKYYQFLVNDGEYGVYSVVDEKNCVTGALYMLEYVPGAMEEANAETLDIIARMHTYFAEHDYDLPESG